jgi:hypothetical protein
MPRIAEVMPDVRLIYLIRDPVDRAYSHYVHVHAVERARPDGSFTMTFEEYFDSEPWLFHISDYLTQIRHLLNWFPRESLLILLFDELVKSPVTTLRKVFRFLDVEDLSETISATPLHANNSGDFIYENVRWEALRTLRQFAAVRKIYYALPRGLRERCIELALGSPLGRRARQHLAPPPMRPGTRRALIDRFAPSFGELSQLAGADLSAWLDPREPVAGAERAATS